MKLLRSILLFAVLASTTSVCAKTKVKDFREAICRADVDAVLVATPDHSHCYIGVEAMKCGKALYLGKPIGISAGEAEILAEVQRRTGMVFQLGTQRRSSYATKKAVDFIRSGEIGKPHWAKAWCLSDRPAIRGVKPVEIPAWLGADGWDLWQCCATRREYRSKIVHYNWRFFKGYGTGDLPNNGLHFVDIARWALGAEWPERVYAGGGHYFCDGEDWNWDDTQMLTVQFPDRKDLTWEGCSHTGAMPFMGKWTGCLVYCELGNVSMQIGDAVHIDPATGKLKDSTGPAAKFWMPRYEPGWELKAMTSRRCFLGGLSALAAAGCCLLPNRKRLHVNGAEASFTPEPILKPFGFKGGYLSELWQTQVSLTGVSGARGVDFGVQSCLWSDAAVFSAFPEKKANGFMMSMTKRAAELAEGMDFDTPPALTERLFPEVLACGRKITGRKDLRPTFVLNALVPLDFAAWTLYAAENGFSGYDEMLPAEFRAAQSARHARCASIPLITYGTSIGEVVRLVKDGYFFLKIKIGHPGTQDEMLAKDCARISAIHEALKDTATPWTDNGRPAHYFDANGRYESKETFLRFVDHLAEIGALERTAIIEEPFDEMNEIDVSDIPARLAADESAHTVEDAEKRMDMGYRAMALKPIAKTLSVSLGVAAAAKRRGVPCFCADLTVSPVMVEWNKAVAARLDAFPGLKGLGLVESNGAQNYVNWEKMRRALPNPDAPWTRTKRGVFELGDGYWNAPFFGAVV